MDFVKHMTSDEVMSTFVTTEVTALKNGASPSVLNPLQQAAADANANITGVVGAVQDTISSECKTDLFANVQNVVTGKMSAADAVNSATAHFSRVFKKLEGVSAGEWRNLHCGK